MKQTGFVLLATCAALAVTGCGKKEAAAPPAFAVQVRAADAVRQPIEDKISLVASLTANEVVDIRSEMEGQVSTINFEEGQPVKEGQVLFELDQGKLEASVAEAEANFKMAEANMKRSESMVANKTISQQEYDQAVATFEANRATLELMKRQWKDSRIFAKFHGIMGARRVSPGQVIDKNTHLTTLVDIDPIKVEVRVPERFLGQLSVGQSITFHVAAYGDEAFSGKVYFIDPQVDENSRTVLVKATSENTDGRLRPGMFGNLDLILRIKENAVLVPESALVVQGDTTSVFIIDDKGLAQPVQVKIGVRLAGKVEVVEGLKGGEKVVTEGTQKLRPGAPVKINEAGNAS